MASLRALRLTRVPFAQPARLFSATARVADDGGPAVSPAVKYNAFRRKDEKDETLRGLLLCSSTSYRSLLLPSPPQWTKRARH
ncbi:hypothetical protein IMZ48_09685 [Candidatus Bathyarchaeota archaeon]|nr:hypothetical protein [Candidatus Bathyarchaeota archaeon]